MRITYLHQYFNTPRDPGGTRSYEMAKRLVAAGHTVNMITSQRNEKAAGGWTVTDEAGIIVHWLPLPYSNTMSYTERIRAFWSFAWRSATRAAGIPADVVFATSTPLTIALPAVWAKRRQKAPMVFEVRDLWPEIPIAVGAIKGRIPVRTAQWLEKFAYDNASAIVALSPGMKEGIARKSKLPEKIHVIPNSCDIELFTVPASASDEFRRRFAWLQDRPLVLYAGALGMINGVGYMAEIAAAAAALNPEVRFLVMGEGVEEQKVREKAAALHVLDKNFFMLSRVPKIDVPSAFSAATLSTSFVIDLPELWANSANKFFDALAAGKPIAINHEGWQADLLRTTGAGIVLPPKDAAGAAQMLVEFLNSPDRIAAATAASIMTREQFDRAKLASQLEQLLAAVVHDWTISRR